LAIPEGFEVEAVGHRTDWNMALRRDARGLVREVVWSGGRFHRLLRGVQTLGQNSEIPGPYEWQARQRYANDQESTWALRTLVQAEGIGLPTQKVEEASNRAGCHDH